MFYNEYFKKSIILMHQEYIKNKQPVKKFINIINKVFNIFINFIIGIIIKKL